MQMMAIIMIFTPKLSQISASYRESNSVFDTRLAFAGVAGTADVQRVIADSFKSSATSKVVTRTFGRQHVYRLAAALVSEMNKNIGRNAIEHQGEN